ncbi:uncharacterized protein LOC112033366 [Quercus suber]|uniref:uncharacterized protein LOC112033366 n=1 Tax=Quercus suber TaxID=58331 RepID=UPI0032DFE71D
MMESFYRKLLSAGKRLLSLIALALNVEEDFFEKVGALDEPNAFLRLLHYPDLCIRLQGVAINFVKSDDIKILRDIEQYYSTQIDEMPMNVADLI